VPTNRLSTIESGLGIVDAGRPKRSAPLHGIYHVLNQKNERMPVFGKDEDFMAFETVLQETVARTGRRLLSYCLVGNHWHLVVRRQQDDELSRFVDWLTLMSLGGLKTRVVFLPRMARISRIKMEPSLRCRYLKHSENMALSSYGSPDQ